MAEQQFKENSAEQISYSDITSSFPKQLQRKVK